MDQITDLGKAALSSGGIVILIICWIVIALNKARGGSESDES